MKIRTGLALIVVALLFILSNLNGKKNNLLEEVKSDSFVSKYEYGILVDSFNVIKGSIRPGQNIGEILYAKHIDHPKIDKIVKKSKEIFDFRFVQVDNNYTVISTKDTIETVCYFIYQENPISYIVVDLTDGIDVYRGEKEIVTKVVVSSG